MFFTISERAKKLERRRLVAARYFNQGKSQAWVAQRCKVTPVAAWKWYHVWEKHDTKGLKSKGRCGTKKKLTKEKLARIKRVLERGAIASGFGNELWTLQRIRRVIRKETRVQYHPGHVWKLLTRDLGWSNQKPTRRARERNESAIRVWRTVSWPAIQKRGSLPAQPSHSLTKAGSPTVRS